MLGTREPPHGRATLVLGLYGAMALAGLLLSAGRGDADVFRLDEDRAVWWLAASVALGLAVGIATIIATRIVTARFAWGRALERDFAAMLGDLSDREIWILAVASAIGEELLFRGALLPWIGLGPQALVFGMLHLGPRRRHLMWTAWAIGMGVGFGLLAQATGDLAGAVVAHFAINFVNLRAIVRADLGPWATRLANAAVDPP